MKHTATFLAAAALLALAGCGGSGQREAPGPSASETVAADPDAKPGITVSGGVLVLPAVKGNPGGAYFVVANSGDAPAALAAVTIDGAGRAELHETRGGAMASLKNLEIKPGETVRFERGGKHVMVFDLAEKVQAGGTAEMTLTFADGDKVSVPLTVETVGSAIDGAGEGMGHGDPN